MPADVRDPQPPAGRILHCIPTMEGGGAERQLAYLSGALIARGWTVDVAVVRRGANWNRLVASGARVHQLPLAGPYDWRAPLIVRRLLREVRPDIVQAWLLQMEVLAGGAALASGTPWVFSERSSHLAYPPSLKNRLRVWMGRRATAIVSNSAGGDAYWDQRAGRDVRRAVIPNAVPLEEIEAAAPLSDADLAALGCDANLPLVLFAGRFGAEKNIARLLPALDRVLATHPCQVLCCGDGAMKAEVETWAGRARRAGYRAAVSGYAANLWDTMKRAAVVVSPSLFEGSPNVVLEAMACGVPLVVSDIPQHRELLDDGSALLVPADSAAALGAALVDVLSRPEAAAARAAAARARTDSYRLAEVARRYDAVYRDILAGRARL